MLSLYAHSEANDSWIKKEKIFSVKSLGFSENSLMHAQRFSYLRKANFYKNSNQHSIIHKRCFFLWKRVIKTKFWFYGPRQKNKKVMSSFLYVSQNAFLHINATLLFYFYISIWFHCFLIKNCMPFHGHFDARCEHFAKSHFSHFKSLLPDFRLFALQYLLIHFHHPSLKRVTQNYLSE